jgi:hypothetical protein
MKALNFFLLCILSILVVQRVCGQNNRIKLEKGIKPTPILAVAASLLPDQFHYFSAH